MADSTESQVGQVAQRGRGLQPVRRFVWGLPLAWQLSVLYTVLLVVTFSLVGWLVYSQQEGFLLKDTNNRLVSQAERIASITVLTQSSREGDGPKGDHKGANEGSQNYQARLIQNLVEGLSGPGITVAVLNTDGTVLTTTQALEGDSASVVETVTAEQVSQVLKTQQPLQWMINTEGGTRKMVVLTEVTQQITVDSSGGTHSSILAQNGSVSITVLVEQVASLAAVEAALGQLGLLLLLGIVGATVVGVALVLAFTQGLLRPLERVVDTADAISAGDLHRRLALPRGRSEVARLGKAFDFMVGRLVATLESQRRFVADASHELRTPLTSLKGLAEILVIGAHGNDTRVIEQSAQSINSELERLIRLVLDLLTLSRLDNANGTGSAIADAGNGRSAILAPKRALTDACETIQAAVDQMAGIAVARNVQLVRECADTLPILGDAGQIKQVLLNLLDNALRYTPERGRVLVRGVRDTGSVTIQVQDTGTGIAPKDLPHIFERFYRGDSSRSRATGNSGLGMAIVKSIVDAHGGSIEVQSQLGEGSCFTVRIPVAHGAHALATRESHAEHLVGSSST